MRKARLIDVFPSYRITEIKNCLIKNITCRKIDVLAINFVTLDKSNSNFVQKLIEILDIKFHENRWKGPELTAITIFHFLFASIFKIITEMSLKFVHVRNTQSGIFGIKFGVNRDRSLNFIKH